MRPSIKFLPAVLAAVPLAGCISFAAAPPPSLLTLTAAVPIPAGHSSNSTTSPTLTIEQPSVPAAIATTRVPVQTSTTSLAYIKDAQWSEAPARLFARLLADTVSAKTGRVVLSPAQALSDPGATLGGELRSFGIDSASGEAVVTYDAALKRTSAGALEKRRFEARISAGKIDAQSAGDAINRAANRVAGDVADWVGK